MQEQEIFGGAKAFNYRTDNISFQVDPSAPTESVMVSGNIIQCGQCGVMYNDAPNNVRCMDIIQVEDVGILYACKDCYKGLTERFSHKFKISVREFQKLAESIRLAMGCAKRFRQKIYAKKRKAYTSINSKEKGYKVMARLKFRKSVKAPHK